MAKASVLRTSVRRTSRHPPELLSVRQAWSKMGHSSWQGRLRAAPTLDLVTTPTAAIGWTTAAEMAAPGVAAAMVVAVVTVGVATPTTAAVETVEAEEARLVKVVAREPARILVEVTGAGPQLWGRPRGTTRRRKGSFHWLQFLFQLVLGFTLGPWRGRCGDRKKASDPFLGECCIFRRETEKTYGVRSCLLYTSPSPRD